MLKEQLEQIHATLGEFLIKSQVAEDEMSDPSSTPEYVAQIKLRLQGRLDALIAALNAIKGAL